MTNELYMLDASLCSVICSKMPAYLHHDSEDQPNGQSNSFRTGDRKTTGANTQTSTLRYRHRTLWLLAIYVPLLIIPWILTCVLVHRPVDQSSYFNQAGLPTSSLKLHRRLERSVAVLNSFTSIVTIPIISALISHAAVVYTQRLHKDDSVSVRQVFALADRGWSNLKILLESWPPCRAPRSKSNGARSGFLWSAAAYLLICECTFVEYIG